MCKTEQDVLNIVKDTEVSFIQFWFTDVLGILKSFAVTQSELEEGLTEGMGFDGSSIEGFARIEESDMIAKPDPTTFQFLPWRSGDRPVARMFCDILKPDGSPYEGDTRYALKRVLKRAADKGYTLYLGPELEYFYFESNQAPKIIDKGGYFDARPLDMGGDLRRDTIFALQDMGIQVEYSHHEVAPSQHEIDVRYDEGLKMADKTMTIRIVVKEIARQHGVYATFMPKPIFGENGSGMHTHQSLFKGDVNAFHDPADKYHLSHAAKCYIAGILKHAREFTAITSLSGRLLNDPGHRCSMQGQQLLVLDKVGKQCTIQLLTCVITIHTLFKISLDLEQRLKLWIIRVQQIINIWLTDKHHLHIQWDRFRLQ